MLFEPLHVEPNDVATEAYALVEGNYEISSSGEDWYSIDVSPGMFSISMLPTDEYDINMVLYNSELSVIAADFQAQQESINYIAGSSETYFLKVFPTAASTSNYRLTIDLPDNTWSKTLDFGPIRDVSVSLFDIDNDGKDEIFVGTSKGLDNNLNEIRPAGFVVLEDTGEIKWAISFDAISGVDPQTGKIYNTTSISTAPAFADLDGDNKIDIVIGVGADTFGEAGSTVVGQPGDKGGVYALNAEGEILWFHESLDVIGGTTNTGEGRADGVYSSPVIFDIDSDGEKEVIYGGWDQSLWILDGRTGAVEQSVHLADTIWSTPKIADIDANGSFEILVSADITENADAQTVTGGIFHIISADGSQEIVGFDQPVGAEKYTTLRGKAEEQALWSSPITADIDGDGYLEIIYGTGNFHHDDRGTYIRVWEHDGTHKFQLDTIGRTFATPITVDLDNDGDMEIVAATLEGYLYGWDHTGHQLFATQSLTYPGTAGNPIFSSPVAVDLTGDGNLEIAVSQGAQTIFFDYQGNQLTGSNALTNVVELFKGSPAIKDIDHDGKIDIISGGNTKSKDQAVVYRNANPFSMTGSAGDTGKYQFHQALTNITGFVDRFYEKVLDRVADSAGKNDWVDRLNTGIGAGADVARGFIFSQEFTNRGVDDETYVNILYSAFFDREPDSAGFNGWQEKMGEGMTREEVLDGFLFSQEFKNLAGVYSIVAVKT